MNSRPNSAVFFDGRAPGSDHGSDADGRQGQGYRELWQRVSRVHPGESQALVTDCTVEDMLRTIKGLHSKQSAIDVVRAGLPYLDSRALAFLLKELGKCKLTHRAFEIFDWLHVHTDESLAQLCDVFTYTTVISLCGSPRLLWKALRLVGCMKAKGIPCNTHTYSSLISVCVKAKQPGLALDVYQEMKRVGCKPSVVTYNTLVDAYGKAGLWQEAINVLDSMVQEGIAPEPRTVNSVVKDTAECGQPDAAWDVYQRFIQSVILTSASYQALIIAYSEQGRLSEALKLLEQQITAGVERTAGCYAFLLHSAEYSSDPLLLPILSYIQGDGLGLEEVRAAHKTILTERQTAQQQHVAAAPPIANPFKGVPATSMPPRQSLDMYYSRGPHTAQLPLPTLNALQQVQQPIPPPMPPPVGMPQPTLEDLQELLQAAQQQQRMASANSMDSLSQQSTAQALGLALPHLSEFTGNSGIDAWPSYPPVTQAASYSQYGMGPPGNMPGYDPRGGRRY